MKKIISASIIGLAFAATPAFAQDGDEANFSGPYVGAYVGYDHVTISVDGSSGSKDGVAFGGIIGYNFNLGDAVVGIEGEFGDASTQQEETDLLVVGDQAILAANRDLFIGARLGFKASPKMLVYVKGGYADTRVKLAYDDNDGFAFSASDNVHGLRIGGGIDYAVGRHVSVRLEYRYTDYSNYKYQGVDTGIGAKRHQVLIGAVGTF